jgi:hypothetical protein
MSYSHAFNSASVPDTDAPPHGLGPSDPPHSGNIDLLASFRTEAELANEPPFGRLGPPPPEPPASSINSRGIVGWALLALIAIITVVAPTYIQDRREGQNVSTAAAAPAPTGTATFDSNPGGAEVSIDGDFRGLTPLTLSIEAGSHTVDVRSGSLSRTLPLVVQADTASTLFVEFAPASTTGLGQIEVSSDPSGAQVSIDGAARGVTPLTLTSLEPGEYNLTISGQGTSVQRRVRVEAGATATVAASLSAGTYAAGWVTFKAPFEMQVFEDERLIGTTGAYRLMLPAGRRELRLLNTDYGFSTIMPVQIVAGQSITAAVAVPNGSLSVNALPWANVLIDGATVGTTPLANLSVPVGPHEVVWRHPQLGERRQAVSVVAQGTTRVAVDFTK